MTVSRFARLSPPLRGHLLLFDRRSSLTPESTPVARLLLIYLLLEVVLGPRLSILRWLHLPALPSWIRVPALLVLALSLLRFVARLEPAQIGLYGWRTWSATERSYFIQTLILGNGVFMFIMAQRLRAIGSEPSLWGAACLVTLTSLAWGVYQELGYRGILQTALVSRLGPVAGILLANTVFTFGPLHFYHSATASAVPMFAGIFTIGLFFSVLFWRSGNLWLVGLLHGLGDAYMDGLRVILS
jgi:membrane protease YdiL (CAAX protease family)